MLFKVMGVVSFGQRQRLRDHSPPRLGQRVDPIKLSLKCHQVYGATLVTGRLGSRYQQTAL